MNSRSESLEKNALYIRGFRPISDPSARTLILGTIPGERSLELGQYYGHPRNVFWFIIESVFGSGQALTYPERNRLLISSGIALWDVLRCARRIGSLDSAIERATVIPNDFNDFYTRHPLIEFVFFNGSNARNLYRRYVQNQLPAGLSIRYEVLPSTSPANARMTTDRKLITWKNAFNGDCF